MSPSSEYRSIFDHMGLIIVLHKVNLRHWHSLGSDSRNLVDRALRLNSGIVPVKEASMTGYTF